MCQLIFRANEAEEGAQNGLKPNHNEVLKLKTTKNLQILEKPGKPALKNQKPAWQVLSKNLRFFRTLIQREPVKLTNIYGISKIKFCEPYRVPLIALIFDFETA
jgi:hypothetical protein